jgi:pSer/pThr/pTyr-binding forkhead associated (FHA) protein
VQPARVKEKKPKRSRGTPTQLTIVNPAAQRGRSFPLGQELSVGRAAGCVITLDDTYVSQLHARVFQQDGQTFVEDLGSTNGTYLNGQKVSGPMAMNRGDQLRVGDTVMELA